MQRKKNHIQIKNQRSETKKETLKNDFKWGKIKEVIYVWKNLVI